MHTHTSHNNFNCVHVQFDVYVIKMILLNVESRHARQSSVQCSFERGEVLLGAYFTARRDFGCSCCALNLVAMPLPESAQEKIQERILAQERALRDNLKLRDGLLSNWLCAPPYPALRPIASNSAGRCRGRRRGRG